MARLRHFEPALMDPEPLARLRAGLGPQLAADLLRRTREDLAFLLASAGDARARGDLPALVRIGRRIEVLCLQIGLPDLRAASENMVHCCQGGDIAAQGATFARLARLGAGAMLQLGDLRLSGA